MERRSKLWLFWGICFLSWVPVWLAYWPVLLNYDAYNQMSQWLAHWFSQQHPLVHTIMMGSFYWLGTTVFQSVNAGFALYAAVQMLLLSGAIAYAVNSLYRNHVKIWVCVLFLVWVCFFPIHPVLAISTTKDILFTTAFLLLFVLSVERMTENNWNRKKQITYLCTLIVFMLFRKNGIYAVIVMELGVIFCGAVQWIKNKTVSVKIREMGILILAGIIMFHVFSFLLASVFHAVEGSKIEALSVPIQQIARVYTEHGNELSAQDKEMIETFIPAEALERYNEHLSDPVKDEADWSVLDENKKEYTALYLRLGCTFPGTYIAAFLRLTQGYWDLFDTSHSRIYGLDGERRQGYLSTSVTEIKNMEPVIHQSLFPSLECVYERIMTENAYQSWPVVSLLFAPAFYVWSIVIGMVLVIWEKRFFLLPGFFLILGYFITILLGPCCLMRYAYPLVLCAPLILAAAFAKETDRTAAKPE